MLKKISPEYSLEGLMLKLKLQYFGHLMRRTDSLMNSIILLEMKKCYLYAKKILIGKDPDAGKD